MLEQIGNPLRIFGVRLAAWDGLDMLSVDHQHLQMPLKQVIDRFPVYAGPIKSQSKRFNKSAVVVLYVRNSL